MTKHFFNDKISNKFRVKGCAKMIELEENTRLLQILKGKILSLGDSL